MADLLLGCGSNRQRKIEWERAEWSFPLVTVDFSDRHAPTVVHDLEKLPLPFDDNSFEQIHAYDVLEHTGRVGDFRFFFAQFDDFWRMLKPNGVVCGVSPSRFSPWAWGDPGHTRILSPEMFVFLNRPQYANVGSTPMSDYREFFVGDFSVERADIDAESLQFTFVLKTHKPVRRS